MRVTELPIAAVERLIKKAGAARVSRNAALALAEILEAIAMDVSQQAVKFSKHAGRKTVTSEDINLAKRPRFPS